MSVVRLLNINVIGSHQTLRPFKRRFLELTPSHSVRVAKCINLPHPASICVFDLPTLFTALVKSLLAPQFSLFLNHSVSCSHS